MDYPTLFFNGHSETNRRTLFWLGPDFQGTANQACAFTHASNTQAVKIRKLLGVVSI